MSEKEFPKIPENQQISFADWMRANGRVSEDVDENMFAVLRGVLDTLNLISVTDPEGKITYANEQFCSVSGFGEKELQGAPHNIVRHPETPSDTFADLWNTIKAKKIWKGLIRNQKKNGGDYWVKTVVVPVVNSKGEIQEYVSLRTDVTDLEIANQKLRETLEFRAELDRKKSEFISIASHELRTPLTIVRGYASMMEDAFANGDPQTAHKCAAEISKQAAHMTELVNDMLELSRIESGAETFKNATFDLSAVISEVVGNFAPIAEKKGISICNETGAEGFLANADRDKIRRAVHNLVSNAVKFTSTGGNVRCGIRDNGDETCSVYVRDTGTGIRKEDFDAIFEKFVQLENPLTRSNEGSGLGLPIVKVIVEGCGGKVEIESEVGKGSEFRIVIPKNR